MMPHVRKAAVAGMFYSGQRHLLQADIDKFIADAGLTATPLAHCPKALLVPHAGYIYSGSVAASAYVQLLSFKDQIKRVVIIGPAHRVAIQGMAIPSCSQFETPLGTIDLDRVSFEKIKDLPDIRVDDGVHEQEHSIEVQLPFLQTVLDDFVLLPVVVGSVSGEAVASLLEQVWGGDETLIVISSDLSHYAPYEAACEMDAMTIKTLLAEKGNAIDHHQACGAMGINGLSRVAFQRHMTPHLLDLRNSGDTAGDKTQVVGYAAMAYMEADDGH